MTSSLARYHARAPRYILSPHDNSLVRLSGAEQWSWEESTELHDVSLTGLTFTAPQDLSPQIGEVIKIQFTVPGSEQMACYAVVIRIEKMGEFENLIGVHFYKLDRLQRINIVQGLAQKLKKRKEDEGIENQKPLWTYMVLVGLVFSLIAWLTLMKFFLLGT